MQAGSNQLICGTLWDFSFNRQYDNLFLDRIECTTKDPGVAKRS